MQVPRELIHKNYEKDINTRIYITKYSEFTPSKICTQVQENLLVLVMQGEKKVCYCDYEMTVKEREFALFKKGNYIMNQIVSKGKFESILIFLSDEVVRKVINRNRFHMGDIVVSYFHGIMVDEIMHEAESLLLLADKKGNEYEEILELKIQELLLYIILHDKSNQFYQLLLGICEEKNFNEFCLKNCTEHSDINKHAMNLNMSASTFKRRFEESFHCSPHKWMNAQKLEKARILLCTTNYLVTDICFLCGFNSVSAFMALFHKCYGISPGAYRKAQS